MAKKWIEGYNGRLKVVILKHANWVVFMKEIDLPEIYNTLLNHFGHRGWWPGDTPLEIIIGAILTQNTSWKNVEKAICSLKKEKILSYQGFQSIPVERLAALIRSSGYYNQKARKIKAFIAFLQDRYSGSLARMFREDTPALREKLLTVKGIGPETADSILLYAGDHPVFVVDLYTYRILTRHEWVEEGIDYSAMQAYFEERLPRDVALFKDFHAQLVAVGNTFCRKKAKCGACPLKSYLSCE